MKAVVTQQQQQHAAATVAGAIGSQQREPAFKVDFGSITPTTEAARIIASIGGYHRVARITHRFYGHMMRDTWLKQFLGTKVVLQQQEAAAADGNNAAPTTTAAASSSGSARKELQTPISIHAHRIALYICETLAGGDAWTNDIAGHGPHRADKIVLASGRAVRVESRADAHFCAWNSVERPAAMVGMRFKLRDCIVWMRLLFRAAREEGFAPSEKAVRGDVAPHIVPDAAEASPEVRFFHLLLCFVHHLIAIYEITARPFAFSAAMWSADAGTVVAYQNDGCSMPDAAQPYAAQIAASPSKWLMSR